MACPVCGRTSPCPHEGDGTIRIAGSAVSTHGEQKVARPKEYSSPPSSGAVPDGEILNPLDDKGRPDDKFWRQEVVSRVQQHRARRRRRFDPHATMELDFPPGMEFSAGPAREAQAPTLSSIVKPEPSKIIKFPRIVTTQPGYVRQSQVQESEDFRLAEPVEDLDLAEPIQGLAEPIEDFELAEPMIDTPRILDAPEPQPEQLDFLPAFADIQLESEESRRAQEVEVPLQPATVGYRLFAGLVDMIVVVMACVLFTIGFVMFTNGLPQSRMALLCGFLVSGSLWLIYEYLFLVYSPGTLGMQLAQLELCTFKGEPVNVSLRRWRALAGVLSAFPAGLGFAWALVDEDTLGWHDRITQTHLRRSGDRVICLTDKSAASHFQPHLITDDNDSAGLHR
jgi:uncharacterized RDD family membrane protein YckC